MKKVYRVVIADDHPAMREAVGDALADLPGRRVVVVGHAADGCEAVDLVERLTPDALVLDVGLPRLDGLAVLRRVKAMTPAPFVMVLSMYDDQAHVVAAVRAGADDYLFKHEARPRAVAGRLLEALDRPSASGDSLRDRLFLALRGAEEKDIHWGISRLTSAELEVLSLAAQQGLSMKEIATALSRPDRPLTEPTVRKHFEHIYEKLGASSQAHAVALAIKHGFIRPDEASPRP